MFLSKCGKTCKTKTWFVSSPSCRENLPKCNDHDYEDGQIISVCEHGHIKQPGEEGYHSHRQTIITLEQTNRLKWKCVHNWNIKNMFMMAFLAHVPLCFGGGGGWDVGILYMYEVPTSLVTRNSMNFPGYLQVKQWNPRSILLWITVLCW